MTFLNPGAGLLAVGIGVPALLLLYFLKLRRRPLRVSSTFLWMQAAQDLQVNVPFKMLRVSWVLLLQLLAGLALCAAIARPALDTGSGEARRVLLLIDRSASMSATDGTDEQGRPTTRLEEAKRRARVAAESLLGRAGRTTQVSVAAFAHGAVSLAPGTQSAGVVREAIDAVTPSDQPGNLDAAVRFAQAMAMDSLSEDAGSEPLAVLLFSDGGFGGGGEGGASQAPGKGLALRFERVGPRPPVAFAEPGAPTATILARHDNAGIVAMSSRRDYDDPSTLRVFVRVQNADARARTATLRLTLDGALVDQRVLELPGAANTPTGIALGEGGTTFTLAGRQGGVLLAQLVEPDLLASDNLAGLAVPAASATRLLLVAPGAGGRDADPFLLSLLGAIDDASLRAVDAQTYEQIAAGVESGDSGGGAGAEFDLVFFDRVQPVRLPRGPSMSFGAGLPSGVTTPGAAPLVRVEPPSNDDAVRIASWRRDHPLLRYVNFDSVVVQPAERVTLPPVPADAGSKPVVLADSAIGPMIVQVEDSRGVRRVVVGFDLNHTNWPPMFSFPVFLQNALDFLTLRAEAASGQAFRTDQPVVVTPAAGVNEVTLVSAADALASPVLSVAVPASHGARPLALGIVERAGLYLARGAAAVVTPVPVAVNLTDAGESALRVAETIELPGGAITAGTGRGAPREVWHWFVLGAMGVLFVEWFVYAWKMRG